MCNYQGQLDQNCSLYAVLAELVLHQIANLRSPFIRCIGSSPIHCVITHWTSGLSRHPLKVELRVQFSHGLLCQQLSRSKASDCGSEEREFESHLTHYSYIAQLARAGSSYGQGHWFDSSYSYLSIWLYSSVGQNATLSRQRSRVRTPLESLGTF